MYVGSSLCKRLKHAKDVKCKSLQELSKLVASNGMCSKANCCNYFMCLVFGMNQ